MPMMIADDNDSDVGDGDDSMIPPLLLSPIARPDLYSRGMPPISKVKDAIDIPMHMVDAHNVVPGEAAASYCPSHPPLSPSACPCCLPVLFLLESCCLQRASQQQPGTSNESTAARCLSQCGKQVTNGSTGPGPSAQRSTRSSRNS